MSKKLLHWPYSDNLEFKVAERLKAEIERNPKRLDVATGYFATSVWPALGGKLKNVENFRLLLGTDPDLAALSVDEESRNVAALVQRAIAQETQPDDLLDQGQGEAIESLIGYLETQKEAGTDEVVKLWQGEGFLHAKAYILDDSAGVGSANFTYNGLVNNRELVGWRQDRQPVDEIREWFDRYWEDSESEPFTDDLIRALRETPLVNDTYTPYEVLIKTLAARYGAERPPSLERATFNLKWFQEDAVIRVVKLLNGPARGALLADAVGLGKTYVAMGIIHHFLYDRAEARRGKKGKPVLIVAPASLRSMWTNELRDKGLDWACEFLTTQSLRDEFDPAPFEGADLIVIDEAHRLRGGGTWTRKAMDLVTKGENADQKRVLLLTATPVNTEMADLTELLRLMTKNQRDVWAPEIADFEKHLKRVEKGEADPFPLLDRSLVRRSRSDILEAQKREGDLGGNVKLPSREAVHIDYDYGESDGDLFDTFASSLRALRLVPYDLERYLHQNSTDVAEFDLPVFDADGEELTTEVSQQRPGTMAALYAAGLLTRFQSSLAAIRHSLNRLTTVLARFDEALSLDPPRLVDLGDQKTVQKLIRQEVYAEGEDGDGDGSDLDAQWSALLQESQLIEPGSYDLPEMRKGIAQDIGTIAELTKALPPESEDGKINALIDSLKRSPGSSKVGAPGLKGKQLLIFSQYRDTARYVYERLNQGTLPSELGRSILIDGGVAPEDRAARTAWFDPDRIGEAMKAREQGEEEPQILVSTDVLAEGHNLQIAEAIVNFDLHFNPQVAVQRSGRIDRLNSQHKKVLLVSMLPPESLDRHIGLQARLDERFRRIHGLGLGDEKTTPIKADVQGKTLEQMRRIYRDDGTVLDEIERTWVFGSTDFMRRPLASFLSRVGELELGRIPYGVSSIKMLPRGWEHGPGVFLALAAPAASGVERETYWRFYPWAGEDGYGPPLRDDLSIYDAIACDSHEPRAKTNLATEGPGIFDWDLIARATSELAEDITKVRAQAEISRGASERSRKLRRELRGGTDDLEIAGMEDLLERLLQVRVEDFDRHSGWRAFDDERRRLRRADALGERHEAAVAIVNLGIELFGEVEAEDEKELLAGFGEVAAGDLRLVAYEVLVEEAVAPFEATQEPLEFDDE